MVKSTELKRIVGLEVGTSKVVAVVGEILADGVVNVLSVGSCPSRGIDKGGIIDMDAVVRAVERAINNVQSSPDVASSITNVTLAISGEHITSLNESGFVPIDSGEVTQDDIERAIHTASAVKLSEGLKALHIIPQEFTVDKQVNIKNPLGLQGVRLTARVHIIACHQDWEANLIRAVERNKLVVDKVVFSGLASSHSVLTEDEKELGVCLIDFGGGTMDITVYTDGAMRLNKTIPYAGNRVTDDIAHICVTSRTEAERIKTTYGSVAWSNKNYDDKQQIQVAGIGGRAPSLLPKKILSDIIYSRYEQLFNLVKDELIYLEHNLKANQMKSELIAGIVLTGGGSQIDGLAECAAKVFNSQVRIGVPMNITGLTEYVNKPQYATVLGLIQNEYYNDDEIDSSEPTTRPPNDGVLDGFWAKMKDFVNKIKSEF